MRLLGILISLSFEYWANRNQCEVSLSRIPNVLESDIDSGSQYHRR